MKLDIAKKRGIFIGKTNSVLQEFDNVPHKVFLKISNSCAANVYQTCGIFLGANVNASTQVTMLQSVIF